MRRASLSAAREQQGLTIEQAAEQLGVDRTTVQRWERGETTPRRRYHRHLCDVYGLEATELDLEANAAPIIVSVRECSTFLAFVANNLSFRLQALVFEPHGSSQDLHSKLTQVLQEYDSMNTDKQAQITRRDALRNLVALPMITLGIGASYHPQDRRSPEILNHCAASIAGCWELSKSRDSADLTFALRGVKAYQPTMKSIVKESPQYRKDAAHLTAQALLLQYVLTRHRESPLAAVAPAREACTYARESGDIALRINAQTSLAWAYYYSRNLQGAIASSDTAAALLSAHEKEVLPLLSSSAHSTHALILALQGQDVTVELEKASDALANPDRSTPPYLDFSEATLPLDSAIAQYHRGNYRKTLSSLSLLMDFDTLNAKAVLPERTRIEAINYAMLAQIKQPQRDMDRALHLWQAGIQGAQTLHSEQRFNEAMTGLDILEAVYPNEKRIKGLRDMAVHW